MLSSIDPNSDESKQGDVMRVPVILAATAVLLAQSVSADEVLKACLRQAAPQLNFNGIVRVERGPDVLEEPFGTSDVNGQVPVQAATRFNIASAGKMFTAVAIAQLVDRNLMSFDAPIGTYLKDARSEFAKITIRELLGHTSGLGDYLNPANHDVIEKARTATALLPLAFASPPAFRPGSQFAYSNSGYIVLGAIIERVTHKTFADYLQQEIFSRARMKDTTLDDTGSADQMTRMSPAGLLDKPILSPLRLPFASPAGGETSTAADMARFMDALQKGELVSTEAKTRLFTPQPNSGGNRPYGLGFNISAGPPLKVGHGGGAPGINAEIALFPASGWTIVTLSNYDPPTASRVEALLERVLFAADRTSASCDRALHDPALTSSAASKPPPAR
jgi:CubicO group peptidase (beta-lactamase class C family)